MPADNQVLTLNEAASYLAISRATLYRLIGRGALPVVRVTEARRGITRADLDAYITSRRSAVA